MSLAESLSVINLRRYTGKRSHVPHHLATRQNAEGLQLNQIVALGFSWATFDNWMPGELY